jgi:5-methylcytosine-specific restriction endonuclease McrA
MEHLTALASYVFDHAHLGDLRLWGALGLLVAVQVALSPGWVRWRRRDPVRRFDSAQRAAVKYWAGYRCEYGWLGRCKRPVQEIDHFYPWAVGGATAQLNAVGACRRHNRSKGGSRPPRLLRLVVAHRRKAYWPAGQPRWPGAYWRRGLDRW